MGDSGGAHLGYEASGPDIRAAVDALSKLETSLEEIVLFGECESASGILFYAYQDPRVKGLALVNPWVRTLEGQAEVIIKHYYLRRLMSRDLWRKVRTGRFDFRKSLLDLAANWKMYLQGRMLRGSTARNAADISPDLPLPVRTAMGLRRFRGQVMVLVSGNDYIAREFDEVIQSWDAWDGLLDESRVCRRDLTEADHTFSREVWKNQASDWVREWLGSW
jgi:exosortase A-associated hydrolase 1